jgi:predicted fused transcriptional regulator/phosphomethylpyrimidine kinase
VGKEPMILIFGKNPNDVMKKTSKVTIHWKLCNST